MLPSTSGGHDPISAARGRDRCFLPGQAQDWGRCAKAGEEAAQGEGEPQNGEPCTQAAGAVASTTEKSLVPPHPLSRTPPVSGRAVMQRRVGAAGRRQGIGHAESGLELEPTGRVGGYRRRTQQRPPPPSHIHITRGHARPRSPLSGLTTVPPLPRARRYLWGSRPAAASRAGVSLPALPLPLPVPAPPGGGATAVGAGPTGSWRLRAGTHTP